MTAHHQRRRAGITPRTYIYKNQQMLAREKKKSNTHRQTKRHTYLLHKDHNPKDKAFYSTHEIQKTRKTPLQGLSFDQLWEMCPPVMNFATLSNNNQLKNSNAFFVVRKSMG